MVIVSVPDDGELGIVVQGLVSTEPLDLEGRRVAVVQAHQLGTVSYGRVQVVNVFGDRGAC